MNSLPTMASGAGSPGPVPSSIGARVYYQDDLVTLLTMDKQAGFSVPWRLCGCCGCAWHGRRQVHELAWLPACLHVPGRAA